MEQKELIVKYGPIGNEQQSIVKLNGVHKTEALTPKMARQAAFVAIGYGSGVTVWDSEYGHGYRVYRNSARKLQGKI